MPRTLIVCLAFTIAIPLASSTSAVAETARGSADFGPAPRTPNGRAANNKLWLLARLARTACAPKQAAELKRLLADADRAILQVPAAERTAYIDYRNRISTHVRGQFGGIPGVGTYAEIATMPEDAVKWYRANEPKTKPTTVAEVEAYLTQLDAYAKRATKDRARLASLTRHPCTRHMRLGRWPGMVTTHNVGRLQQRAEREHLPSLQRLKEARAFVQTHTGAKYDRRLDLGRMLHDAVSLYTNMQDELKLEPAIMKWITMLRPGLVTAAKAESAEYRVLMKQVAALYSSRIREVTLPKKAGGGQAQGIARKLVRGAVRVYATSGVRRVNNPQSEIFRAQGKLWQRTWNESLEEVDIWYISKEKPRQWFVDMPGVPLKKVCSLKTAAAHRYLRAINVPRNKWLLEEDNEIAPILCSAR